MATSLNPPNHSNQNGWSLTFVQICEKLQKKEPIYQGTIDNTGNISAGFVNITSITADGIMIDGKQAEFDVNHFFKSPYEFFKYQIQIRDELERSPKCVDPETTSV